MKKVSRIILLSLIFCFSIFTKAETKQQLKDHQSTVKVLTVDKLHVFLDDLEPYLLSGKKKQIKKATDDLIKYLQESKRLKFIAPSLSGVSENSFSQLIYSFNLESAEEKNQKLIELGKLYSSSAINNHKRLKKVFQTPKQNKKKSYGQFLFESAFYTKNKDPYALAFYDSIQEQKHKKLDPAIAEFLYSRIQFLALISSQVKTITNEWRMALMFFSLAGFDSVTAKNHYIHTLHQYQLYQKAFLRLYKEYKKMPGLDTVRENDLLYKKQSFLMPKETNYTHTLRNFELVFQKQKKSLDFIPLVFKNLSWINKDLKKHKNPEMLFEYGRILNTFDRAEGLSYLYKAEKNNYLPVINYFITVYDELPAMEKHSIKMNFENYIKDESLNLMTRVKIAKKLLSIETSIEENPFIVFKKAKNSLKNSCQSLFKK